MSAWLLPDQIADVLPSEARHLEELRRTLLEAARRYGYELVIPPLLEYLESLLTGTGEALELQTFKLVDQLSGRMLGLRADTTPQVARIDAHLLNRQGVTRLCYCGPVLHTRAGGVHGTREPLQFGAEIYGHAGREAELEILELALDALGGAGLAHLQVDLGDVRVVQAVLEGCALPAARVTALHHALAAKDVATLDALTHELPRAVRDALRALPQLWGDVEVLAEAACRLPSNPALEAALDDLRWLHDRLRELETPPRVTFDLADLRGYAYYTGVRFSVLGGAQGRCEVARGGRYDAVGAAFGRQRPAVGFSLDVKSLVGLVPAAPLRAAIRAPWRHDDRALRATVAALRAQGETVVCVLPGHEHEVDEFACDRELVLRAGAWVVQPLAAP
ncbi:ATP phosphoribosyltransferase regulatory subunit [Tepidimonas alkaliphilus]|uniref:ATP phosphoribosyltransferase regulatory subunit n=1 Tax=Tepidimonas alkaliphilus TaxID=2588942 RepID=A0A554WDD2_9BURK|nr:ATP phosphoribosyltransferase regulatory subunit [Tepidimonas alkaliphilus]TSE21576.1 ATP phosphoribosyltransferase regulatory subunit [Tepidimonas alkaliphilus]